MEEKRCNAFENALWHDIRASSCCICSIKCSNHEKQSHQQREKMCMINWKHHINYCLSLLLSMQNPKKNSNPIRTWLCITNSNVLVAPIWLFFPLFDFLHIFWHRLHCFPFIPFLGMFEINHTQNASDITFFLGELCRFRRKWKIWKKTDHMLLITLYAEPSKYSVGTFCERIEECVAMPRRRVKCRIIDMKFLCVCVEPTMCLLFTEKRGPNDLMINEIYTICERGAWMCVFFAMWRQTQQSKMCASCNLTF